MQEAGLGCDEGPDCVCTFGLSSWLQPSVKSMSSICVKGDNGAMTSAMRSLAQAAAKAVLERESNKSIEVQTGAQRLPGASPVWGRVHFSDKLICSQG